VKQVESAAGQGFEPQFPRPERGVLPLHHPAKYKSVMTKLCLPLHHPAIKKQEANYSKNQAQIQNESLPLFDIGNILTGFF
jgi:hypothetical protein